ncbi:MAG: DUF4190 domain-containing protein [Candidatus Azambacteria bacterium]|nr:DUF4190 domain-containing protein [Candidatus Azambacteria bacterium]
MDTEPVNPIKNEETPKKKWISIASLIFGIIGGTLSTFSLVAIICGHVALYKIKKYPNVYAGKGITIAGLVLGYLGLAIAITLGILRGLTNNIINNLP